MAVRMKYGNLSYVQQPDARGLDLTSFRETGNAIVATAANLQERAIRNENAYNEMTIKMSEYNAIEGKDEMALATKIDDTQKAIKEKVDEDGGWFFADTAVTEGARKFLTDNGVKTILNNKAGFDQIMQLNEASDASAEYKAINRAMILEKFNAAGGSLGFDGNRKNSIYSFGTALGKGHDRSVIEKELLEIGKAFKADKNYIYKPQVIGDITELMKIPGTPDEVKDACAKIIANRGGALPGYIGQDLNVEVVTEDEVRAVFTSILMNKPEFKQALMKEAELDLWMANKQGIKASDLIKDGLLAEANANENVKKQLLTTAGFNNLSKEEQDAVLNDDLKLTTFLDKGINATYSILAPQQGETEEAYEARMGTIYSNNYFTNNINRMINISGIFAYQQVTGSSKAQFFDSILSESIRYNHKKMEALKDKNSELIGFTRGTLPANAMLNNLNDNIATAKEVYDSAQGTLDRLDGLTDDSSETQKALARSQMERANTMLTNYRRQMHSIFTQIDMTNPKHYEAVKQVDLDFINNTIDNVPDEDIIKTLDILKAYRKDNGFIEVPDAAINYLSEKTNIPNIREFIDKFNSVYIEDENDVIKDYMTTPRDRLMGELSKAKSVEDRVEIVDKYKDYIYEPRDINPIARPFIFNTYQTNFLAIQYRGRERLSDKGNYDVIGNRYLLGLEDSDVSLQGVNYTQFTSIDPNGGTYTDATSGLGMLLDNNSSVWMIESASYGGKFMDDLIGMPLSYIKENIPAFSSKKAGNKDNATYQPVNRRIDIVVDDYGNKKLKIVIPPQGSSKLPQEIIVGTKDQGALQQLTEALQIGAQCCYNHAQTNPYNPLVKSVANEMVALAGLTSNLGADLEMVTDPTARNMINTNIINGEYVGNVKQALTNIIKDNNISSYGNDYDITVGAYKFRIGKYRNGTYDVKIYQYDNESKYKMLKYNAPLNNYAMFDETLKNEDGSYKELEAGETAMKFPIRDKNDLLNQVPALIYKLVNLERFMKEFKPTQVSTPQQESFYQASMKNNPILL